MTGMSLAACTIAQAIRWVKLSFLPAAFSCLRRPSRVSTSTVRKLVAVGNERLSFMKRASVAAGPRVGFVPASAAGAGGGGAPVALIAALAAGLVFRPRGAGPGIGQDITPL